MKRFIKILILVLTVQFFVSAAPAQAFNLFNPKSCDNSKDSVCLCKDANGDTVSGPVCNDAENKGETNPVSGPKGAIQGTANVLALVVGIAAVIVIIIAGLQFVTSGGALGGQRSGDSPTKAAKARSTITYAVVGLAVTALAWTIITFVIQRVIKT